MHLERNHARLLSSLEESGMRVAVQQLEGLDLDGKRNMPWKDFGHRQSDGEEVDAVSYRPCYMTISIHALSYIDRGLTRLGPKQGIKQGIKVVPFFPCFIDHYKSHCSAVFRLRYIPGQLHTNYDIHLVPV